jgi:hypothetical protein
MIETRCLCDRLAGIDALGEVLDREGVVALAVKDRRERSLDAPRASAHKCCYTGRVFSYANT